LLVWASDVARAVSAGTDPFRSRVPEWLLLGPVRRAPMLREIAKALGERCKVLEARLARISPIEREQTKLELELHRIRLRWISKAK
jgi:hypothetical protein